MGPDSGVYKVVLVLHLLAAIVGFGGHGVTGFFGAMAAARRGREGAAIGEAVDKGYKFPSGSSTRCRCWASSWS